MTYVKICGCRSVEEALAARGAGADFIGLVFAESPRHISIETAKRIVDALKCTDLASNECRGGLQSSRHLPAPWEHLVATKRPLLIGVFEGEDPDKVESIAERSGMDVVQLHGCASSSLSSRFPLIVAVEDPEGLNRAGDEMVVLDGSRGRGKRGDWESPAAIASKRPVILAGGLTPENVAEAIRRVRPWAVDVSSGVETNGRKDATKIQAFVAAAKGAFDDFSS
jgi:phosphoribosylanthranilate isomerase